MSAEEDMAVRIHLGDDDDVDDDARLLGSLHVVDCSIVEQTCCVFAFCA